MRAVAALMLMTTVVCASGCKKDNVDGTVWVDLGLPSGTLWAFCNVGATQPEGYGDYFAWGETEPKDYYNEGAYKWYDRNSWLTKYCTKSSYGYNGFTDSLTTLQPSDDAATANWGSDWRIPTSAEWDELISYCDLTETTRKFVKGILFTSRYNGNRIFLPAAGYFWYGGLDEAGRMCCYWSSSLDTVDPNRASNFDNGSNSEKQRCYGLSVRAVRAN